MGALPGATLLPLPSRQGNAVSHDPPNLLRGSVRDASCQRSISSISAEGGAETTHRHPNHREETGGGGNGRGILVHLKGLGEAPTGAASPYTATPPPSINNTYIESPWRPRYSITHLLPKEGEAKKESEGATRRRAPVEFTGPRPPASAAALIQHRQRLMRKEGGRAGRRKRRSVSHQLHTHARTPSRARLRVWWKGAEGTHAHTFLSPGIPLAGKGTKRAGAMWKPTEASKGEERAAGRRWGSRRERYCCSRL